MSESMQHDLLGYVLDALEPDERGAVEARIERDPLLQEQLVRLRSAVRLLEDVPSFEPPSGLAARTCAAVLQASETAPLVGNALSGVPSDGAHRIRGNAADRNGTEAVPYNRSVGRKPRREPLTLPGRAWKAADMVVAVGVCVAAFALIFPLIHASRAHSQVATCANKLREIGLALTGYSERHNGLFPEVAERGNLSAAGVYAPTLVESGFLGDSRIVICPGSPLADLPGFRIPKLDEVREATPERLQELRAAMGGSYGYAIGYRENGRYKPTRNRYRDGFALAADVPDDDLATSPNHGRCGCNTLLEDGHVIYLCTSHLDGSNDDIFRNDLGLVAPGCHVNDSVVARSDVSPSP
jgi:hypothetical protein